MTTYTGSGSATLAGMSTGADGTIGKDGFHVVQLKYPFDQNRVQSTNVPVQMVVSHTGSGTATDVQLQVSAVADFASLAADLTLTNQPDGYIGVVVTGLTDQTKYWWRARASRAGEGAWQPWTAALTFLVDTATGRAIYTVSSNIGVIVLSDMETTHFSHENVGLEYFPASAGLMRVDENVALEFHPDPDAVHMAHEGDVSTHTPTPRIWFLKPSSAKAGDGVRIFCFGAGDLAATFNGVVEVNYGGSRGWQALNVVSWQTFPPGPNAYTEGRVLDPVFERVDMQHTVIEVTVPNDAVPPGYGIRIRTEGP
jgi:hypothetical protein